jgi:hypothetical protein
MTAVVLSWWNPLCLLLQSQHVVNAHRVQNSVRLLVQGHHQKPWTITEREFCNNVHKVLKPSVPFSILCLAVGFQLDSRLVCMQKDEDFKRAAEWNLVGLDACLVSSRCLADCAPLRLRGSLVADAGGALHAGVAGCVPWQRDNPGVHEPAVPRVVAHEEVRAACSRGGTAGEDRE